MWASSEGPRPRLHEYCAALKKGGASSTGEDARQTSRRSCARVGAVYATTTRRFPMFVVRVADLLSMTEARPHQALRSKGIVVEYGPELGVATFVSHQWCSSRHPDPLFQQLGVLQGVFRNAMQGKLALRVDLYSRVIYHTRPCFARRDIPRWVSGCVWYDYFSVPQPDAPEAQSDQHVHAGQALEAAVLSIPSFVNSCEVFIILAPPLPHVDEPSSLLDYRSWKGRGWCRLERVARLLSPRRTNILLVRDQQTLVQVGALDYLFEPVGEGEFSVASDRARLAPIVLELLTEKLEALLRAGDLHRYRWYLFFRTSILRGLPGVDPQECTAKGFGPLPCNDVLERFLDLYGFRSAVDRSNGTGPPIFFAASLGDPELVRGLLARRASLDSRMPHGTAEFVTHKGFSVLHVASGTTNDPLFMEMLIKERADVEANDVHGITPLMSAVIVSDRPVVATLLTARANAHARSHMGMSTLSLAAITGKHMNILELLSAGVPAGAEADGVGPLLHAVLFGAGADTVAALLTAADCDVEAPCSPKDFGIRALLGSFALQYRLGSRTQFAYLGYHGWRATPLAIAAIMGSVAEARALVAAGANTAARNPRGKTAAELAELVGLSPASVAIFRGAAADVGPAASARQCTIEEGPAVVELRCLP